MIKRPDELTLMAESGRLLASVFAMLDRLPLIGVSTLEINDRVERFIIDELGARPASKGQYGYGYALNASVNQVVCHGVECVGVAAFARHVFVGLGGKFFVENLVAQALRGANLFRTAGKSDANGVEIDLGWRHYSCPNCLKKLAGRGLPVKISGIFSILWPPASSFMCAAYNTKQGNGKYFQCILEATILKNI